MKRLLLLICAFGINLQADETISIRGDIWCPYNCEPGAKPGFMIEIAQAAFAASGKKIDYQMLNWARAISDSRKGEYTAIVGAAKPDAPDFIFPKLALGVSRACFYTSKKSTWNYNGISSLDNNPIGVIKDYTYGEEFDNYVKKYEKDPKRIDIVSGDNPRDINMKKLKAQRITAFMEDEVVMTYEIGKKNLSEVIRPAGCIKEMEVYVAFSPKNPKAQEYADTLSTFISSARTDGRLAAILKNYGLKDWAPSK